MTVNTEQKHSEALDGTMIINGKLINLFDLKSTPGSIEPTTLIKGLMNIIRFNGYSGYSVAQHSFVLSNIVENVVRDLMLFFTAREGQLEIPVDFNQGDFGFIGDWYAGKTINKGESKGAVELIVAWCAYDALIHDMSESLTGDIIRPFKQLVPEISKLEAKVDKQIRQYHLAMPVMPKIVDILDKQMATIEAYYLTRHYGKTLIDTASTEQVTMFNKPFYNELVQRYRYGVFCLNNEESTRPISEWNIQYFLDQGLTGHNGCYATHPASIDAVMKMEQVEFLSLYLTRMNNLLSRVKRSFDYLRNGLDRCSEIFKLPVGAPFSEQMKLIYASHSEEN